MTHQVKALATNPNNLTLIPGTHMVCIYREKQVYPLTFTYALWQYVKLRLSYSFL